VSDGFDCTPGTKVEPIDIEPASPADEMLIWLHDVGACPDYVDPSDAPSLWVAACRDLFAKRRPELAGQVWDDIWTGIPFGDMLWVAALDSPANHGLIRLPDNARIQQQEGWVLSVGWGINRENHRGRRSPWANPLELVGQRVFWSAFTGTDLGVGLIGQSRYDRATGQEIPERNRPKQGQYLSLLAGDIFGLSLKEGGMIREPEETKS